jgi:hypothetical protein
MRLFAPALSACGSVPGNHPPHLDSGRSPHARINYLGPLPEIFGPRPGWSCPRVLMWRVLPPALLLSFDVLPTSG